MSEKRGNSGEMLMSTVGDIGKAAVLAVAIGGGAVHCNGEPASEIPATAINVAHPESLRPLAERMEGRGK